MICPKCNKEIEDGARVCEFCGEVLEGAEDTLDTPEAKAEQAAETALETELAKGIEVSETENAVGSIAVETDAEEEFVSDEAEGTADDGDLEEIDLESFEDYTPQKRMKKGAVVGIAAVAVCIVAAIIIVVMSFGGNAEAPVKNMMNGLNNANSTLFFKAYPAAYQTVIKHNRMIAVQLGEQVTQQTEEFKENFGEKAKIVYNVTNKQPVSDEELSAFSSDLSEMFSSMESMYGEDFGNIKVSKGYVLSLDLSVQNTEKQASESLDVTVLKINGVWSVDLDDIGTLASVFYEYGKE